jgi:hypothetical protein
MSFSEFTISPKFKKSFVEFNYLEKNINNKKIKLIRELVWRNGEINVSINNKKLKEFNTIEKLFKSITKHNVLLFDNKFPFEYEFVSSYDGCSDDYSLSYEDGSDVEDELEDKIMNIIEEEGVYELEDNHNFEMVDTTYEIYGEINIEKIN